MPTNDALYRQRNEAAQPDQNRWHFMTAADHKGGVTIPLFDCVFNPVVGSITSFVRDYDDALYRELPNLYAVCVAERTSNVRRIVAGFFVKTSYTHHDPEFVSALSDVLATSPTLCRFVGPGVSLLPARLGVAGPAPLTEAEMLRIMFTQYTKHSTGGSA